MNEEQRMTFAEKRYGMTTNRKKRNDRGRIIWNRTACLYKTIEKREYS